MTLALMRLAGVPLLSPDPETGEQEEYILPVGGLAVPCHLDFTFEDGGRAIPGDVKSMNSRGFEEFKAAIADPGAKWWADHEMQYLAQLRLYMRAKNVDYGVFVGVDKEAGHLAELHVGRSVSFDEEIDRRAAIIKQHYEAGTVPENRPSWATTEILPGANQRANGSKGPVEEVKQCRAAGRAASRAPVRSAPG
jgi:hypothetical protein